eukprot:6213823-Pleurochrysis_carterae.AAC.2
MKPRVYAAPHQCSRSSAAQVCASHQAAGARKQFRFAPQIRSLKCELPAVNLTEATPARKSDWFLDVVRTSGHAAAATLPSRRPRAASGVYTSTEGRMSKLHLTSDLRDAHHTVKEVQDSNGGSFQHASKTVAKKLGLNSLNAGYDQTRVGSLTKHGLMNGVPKTNQDYGIVCWPFNGKSSEALLAVFDGCALPWRLLFKASKFVWICFVRVWRGCMCICVRKCARRCANTAYVFLHARVRTFECPRARAVRKPICVLASSHVLLFLHFLLSIL